MLQETDPELRAMAAGRVAQLEPELVTDRGRAEGPAAAEGSERREERGARNPRRHRRRRGHAVRRRVFRMYSRYAETQRWKVEVTSSSESAVGGLKEVIALISGNKVYSKLKYESGVHRVQRVPATETAGPRPHLGDHGGGAAGSRRSRNQDRGEGHPHRYVLLVRSRRPVGEHHLLRGPHHAPADRRWWSPARTKSRRSRTAPRRSACCARASTSSSWRSSRRRSAPSGASMVGIGRPQREDPHLQLPAESRHRSPHRADASPARPRHGRQARPDHRRADHALPGARS